MGIAEKDGKDYLLGVWKEIDAARDYLRNHRFAHVDKTRIALLNVPEGTRPQEVVAFAREYAKKNRLDKSFIGKSQKTRENKGLPKLIEIYQV